MLAPYVIAEIRRLLAEDRISQRQIAQQMGVSRNTVFAIAADRRPERDGRCLDETLDELPSGPPQRCADCGGLVLQPCRLCRVRQLAQRHSFRQRRNPRSSRRVG